MLQLALECCRRVLQYGQGHRGRHRPHSTACGKNGLPKRHPKPEAKDNCLSLSLNRGKEDSPGLSPSPSPGRDRIPLASTPQAHCALGRGYGACRGGPGCLSPEAAAGAHFASGG